MNDDNEIKILYVILFVFIVFPLTLSFFDSSNENQPETQIFEERIEGMEPKEVKPINGGKDTVFLYEIKK